jgi:hypothetical protein
MPIIHLERSKLEISYLDEKVTVPLMNIVVGV